MQKAAPFLDLPDASSLAVCCQLLYVAHRDSNSKLFDVTIADDLTNVFVGVMFFL